MYQITWFFLIFLHYYANYAKYRHQYLRYRIGKTSFCRYDIGHISARLQLCRSGSRYCKICRYRIGTPYQCVRFLMLGWRPVATCTYELRCWESNLLRYGRRFPRIGLWRCKLTRADEDALFDILAIDGLDNAWWDAFWLAVSLSLGLRYTRTNGHGYCRHWGTEITLASYSPEAYANIHRSFSPRSKATLVNTQQNTNPIIKPSPNTSRIVRRMMPLFFISGTQTVNISRVFFFF